MAVRLNSTIYMLSFGSVADVFKNWKKQINHEKVITKNGSTLCAFKQTSLQNLRPWKM